MATLPFFLWGLTTIEDSSEIVHFCYGAVTMFVLTFRRFSTYFKELTKFQQN